MKRVRDLALVTRECDAAREQWSALLREIDEHPDTVHVGPRTNRERLAHALPALLCAELMALDFGDEYGLLEALQVGDGHFEVDGRGIAEHFWELTLGFERGGDMDFCISTDPDATLDEFETVTFYPNQPLRMWRQALRVNDNDPVIALAAFCYACCAHLGDWTANPADAFPVPTGKKETSAD